MQLIEEVERVLLQAGLRKVVFQEGQNWVRLNGQSIHRHADGILYLEEESETTVRLSNVSSETPTLSVGHPLTGIISSQMYGEFRWSYLEYNRRVIVLGDRQKFLRHLKKHLGWSDSNKLR